MSSKRYKKLPEKTLELQPEKIEKLLSIVKQIVQQNLMNLWI